MYKNEPKNTSDRTTRLQFYFNLKVEENIFQKYTKTGKSTVNFYSPLATILS